jgi:simple sugar transport system ATP-binding protein
LRRERRPGVLVTVIDARGHAPREAGAKLVVMADATWGSIGGGNLEETAITRARAMLDGIQPTASPQTVEVALSDKARTEHGRQCFAEMMVGRPVLFRLEKPETERGEPVLTIDGLLGEGKLNGISLEVHAGEILGIAGVEGNGQRELSETIIGLRHPAHGSVVLNGTDITGWSVKDIRNRGVAFIPEDRHEQGLVLDMTLWENVALGRHDDAGFSTRAGVLLIRKIKELAERLIRTFDVRARSISVTAGTLSGGNQQKLILARELDTDPKLLIAAQPTRGLDVGAIEFVWRQILEQKAAGRAVLLISAELDEIYALSDRILSLYEGRITGEYPPDAAPEDLGVGMLGGDRSITEEAS